jgi:VWFA-related protein
MRAVVVGLLLFSLQSRSTGIDRVVQRASVYANEYLQQLGSVVGEERYVQEAAWEDFDAKGRRIRSHRERQMVSDLLSIPVGETWIGFRHVRQVDGITLDPLYRGFVRGAFDEKTAEGRKQLQERLTFESVRYNIGDFMRPANLPTFPLEILDPDNLKLFNFSNSGDEVIDGVHTSKIKFNERIAASFVMSTGIGPSLRVSLSGTFWIEPSTGRIFQSDIAFRNPQREKTEMRMQVRFRANSSLGLLVPISMEEHFRDPVLRHEVDCNADYLNFRHFETGVQLRDPSEFLSNIPPESDLKQQTEESYSVKVDVHLVNVDAWVTATSGMAVTDLGARDFEILENKVEQSISNFSPVNTPYDVLLLFDHSGSTVSEWRLMQRATEEFVSNVRPQDRVGIANFDTSLRMLTRWTDTRQQIAKTIDGLTAGRRPGGTAFYKAVEQSIAAELPPVAGRRRALVILSDGRDNGLFNVLMREGYLLPSQEEPEFEQMIALIRRERIPVYVVAVNGEPQSGEISRLHRRFPSSVADDYLEAVRIRLESVAESSGGRVVFSNKLEDVIPLYRQISRELGTAYSIGYVSNIPPFVQGFREITVLTRDKRLHVVQSRPGYQLELKPE